MVRSSKIKRKIAVIASSRATYGYKKRIIKQIYSSKDLELLLFVTGSHPLSKYGHSIDEIINDEIPITAQIDMLIDGDTPATFAKSLGVEMLGLAQAFQNCKPDILLVTGDRGEMFIACATAAYMNIPVAHIQSGDVSGHIDGAARHAMTKLSHIHFPSCKDSADRVINMGEEPWRVFNVGAPQLDIILEEKRITKNVLSKKLKVDLANRTVLCIFHSTLVENDKSKKQMENILKALSEKNLQTIVIFPNMDTGNAPIIKTIEKYKKYKNFTAFSNLDRSVYISLMSSVSLLIGNSSSGILEAPSFKLPVINIGNRQRGRMQASNIINCNFEIKNIKSSIDKVFNDKKFKQNLIQCRNPYGDGKSSKRIVNILRSIVIDNKLLDKKITY